MSEFYYEQLVGKKTVIKDMILPGIFITITVLMLGLTLLIIPIAMPLVLLFMFIDMLLLKRLNLEYEYLCLNGDVDIDKVIAKSKRKHILTIKIDEIQVMAPLNHAELKKYENIKTYNYSSHKKTDDLYKAILVQGEKKIAVIFEPKKEILDAMKMKASRKIFI